MTVTSLAPSQADSSKKRFLITGSNGLLGQKLVELLIQDASIQTIATARGENRLPFKENYEYLPMDITDPEQIEAVVAATKPDVIIHTAAMTNVDQCEMEKDDCWKQNVNAVEFLVLHVKDTMYSSYTFPLILFSTGKPVRIPKKQNLTRSVFTDGANMPLRK